MTPALAPLLAVLAAAAPAGKPGGVVVRAEGTAPDPAPVRLATADDVARLCAALEPAERVRAKGDAVERGEAETRHDADRDAAISGRYEVVVPGARLAFAPYEAQERRLALAEPEQLPVADGTARLWPVDQRGLAVTADAAAARRILEAQRAGALTLALSFDLPDDATCGTGARGKKFTVPVDPVSWSWSDGTAVLARGGAGSEKPLATLAQGARPWIDVGDPIAGPTAAKKAVRGRAAELRACYLEALKRDPALDGVLVADIGGAKPAIAADSVGDADLAACVARALGPLAAVHGSKVVVPIRFELLAPGTPDPKIEPDER